ncbi:MAG: hypothetical protein MRERV_40c012 [Mycoplasmataceae bacterium RV_VA103A]|nr:MAG: hypothetical protein MRERV_40c012 [Mycoplasmataceae bacterium RV_VA103A]
MLEKINCCHVAIAGLIGWLISSTIQHIRIAKIRVKEMELELRTKELEKKNGAEMKKMEELNKKIEELEKKLNGK